MDEAEKESDQIKASELLGRSEADFTEKHIVEQRTTIEITDEDERKAWKKVGADMIEKLKNGENS